MSRCQRLGSASLGVLSLLSALAVSSPIEAQDSSPAVLSPVFASAPRELRQQLLRAQDLCAERRFADAARELGSVAAALDGRDYFLADTASVFARGLKAEFQQAMHAQAVEVWHAYEQLFGAEAQGLLDEAVANQDISALESVFFAREHTSAGRQAGLLLARLHLDRARPTLAVRLLMQLAASKDRQSLEPELSMLLATGQLQTGHRQHALATLDHLSARQPDCVVELQGQRVPLFGGDTPPLELLARCVPPPITAKDEWKMYRGDSADSTVVTRVEPRVQRSWSESVEEESLSARASALAAQGKPAIPVLSPLFVRDQVVARTSTCLLGLSAEAGQMLWRFPSALLKTVTDTNGSASEAGTGSTAWQEQRVWRDASHGRTSSDGRRVFLVEELDRTSETATRERVRRFPIFGEREPPQARRFNTLVALDLARQGALAWMAGDQSGECEPQLAEAMFLGPPLPLHDKLYVLIELNATIELVELDAASGKKHWSLALARLDSQESSEQEQRTFAGATPAFADGILVLPTSAGAIAALDLATRSFLWGFQYQSTLRPPGEHWLDPAVVIVKGRVIVASGQEDLCCLDLATGSVLWQRRRADSLYTAVAGETLVLVGQYRFTAVGLTDGKPVWRTPFVAIPRGGMPSGRGLHDGQFYYLPTTDPELLRIDLDDGRIVARHELDAALGNLIRAGGSIVSQAPSTVTLFGRSRIETAEVANGNQTSHSIEVVASRSPRELAELLGSEQFAIRDAATRALLSQGDTSAVLALKTAILRGDPETAYRGSLILTRWLDSRDDEVAFQARQALRAVAVRAPREHPAANALARETRRRAPVAMKKLEELGAAITDNGSTASLRTAWTGGNEGLMHLRWLPDLKSAELRNSTIDNVGLLHLRGLDQLESLNLNRAQVTSEGLAQLAHLPNLKTLLLQGTAVDDNAIDYLRPLKQLRAINLLGTNFTSDGVEKLRRALPEAKVLY